MKRILLDKTCVCGVIFRPRNSLRRFCSRKCNYENRPLKGKYVECWNCKTKVYRNPCRVIGKKNTGKMYFCSRGCFNKGFNFSSFFKKCGNCLQSFKVYQADLRKGGGKFCSKQCMTKKLRGKKASSWKGGVALKKRLWKVFSMFIRLRDNGTCISCGQKRSWKEMDAGHYVPRTAGLALYFDEQNVNCQCTYCNRWMHGNLSKYALALQKKYGKEILEQLDNKRREIRRISSQEYTELTETYIQKIRDFGVRYDK